MLDCNSWDGLDGETAEACIPLFEVLTTMAIGNKEIMNAALTKFDATDGERKGFEKIQECYNEGGLKTKFLDTTVLESVKSSDTGDSERRNDFGALRAERPPLTGQLI
ncbi:hypothetical protein U0070_014004, partial [Myodes glareolus]